MLKPASQLGSLFVCLLIANVASAQQPPGTQLPGAPPPPAPTAAPAPGPVLPSPATTPAPAPRVDVPRLSPVPVAPTSPGQPQPGQAGAQGPQVSAEEESAQALRELDAKLAAFLSGERGLTADMVAERAAATSVEVRARQAALGGAEARTDQAQYGYIPTVQVSGRYTRLSPITLPNVFGPGALVVSTQQVDQPRPVTPDDLATGGILLAPGGAFPQFFNQYEFKGTLSVPISDYVLRVSNSVASASRSERAAALDVKAARVKAAADARIAFYDWVRARGQRIVAEQSLEQAQGHYRDAQQAFSVGTVSRADVLRAEAQVRGVELLVERARHMDRLAEQQLRVMMHEPNGGPYSVGENILGELPPMPTDDNLEAMHDEAMKNRLEIRALDETDWSLKEQQSVVKASYLPRLDASANGYYANPNLRFFPQQDVFRFTWDLNLVLSWTPSEIPITAARVREIESRRLQIDAQKMAIADGLRVEVLQAYQALKEAEFGLKTSETSFAAALESYRVRRNLYRNGRATLVEITDAETELTRARLEAVNARIEARVARVRLNHALGRDTRDARDTKPL
jgi:outer membrane protein TolC